MQGQFSLPVLQALLKDGIEVCAVVLPASSGSDLPQEAIYRREQVTSKRPLLPVLHSALHSNILQLAWEQHIPVWEVARLVDDAAVSTLAAYQADCICVACFSHRIPESILALPPLGCLNVHPSLLPANRGPAPLFWIFHQGLKQSGVTIHVIDRGMDTGDILTQEVLEVPSGISYSQLERLYAMRGGELLAQALAELFAGHAVCTPQNEAESSYQPYPCAEDYLVPVATWKAEHVYNFICGLADEGELIRLQIGATSVPVKKAISYSHKIDIFQNRDYVRQGSELWVRCNDGWVAVATPASFQQY